MCKFLSVYNQCHNFIAWMGKYIRIYWTNMLIKLILIFISKIKKFMNLVQKPSAGFN